jgi:hypothetical protein
MTCTPCDHVHKAAHLPVLCAYDELQPLKQAMGNEAVVQLEEALAAQWVTGTHAQQEEALHLVEYLITQLLMRGGGAMHEAGNAGGMQKQTIDVGHECQHEGMVQHKKRWRRSGSLACMSSRSSRSTLFNTSSLNSCRQG